MSDDHDPAKMETELRRLRAGKFNSNETIAIARGMSHETWCQLERLHHDWSSKLMGLKKPASEEERRQLRLCHAGLSSTCCDCGEDYPRADHIIDGEVFCATCREKEVWKRKGARKV